MIDARKYSDRESLEKAMIYEDARSRIEHLKSTRDRLECSLELYSIHIKEHIESIDNDILKYQKIIDELKDFIVD